ncbi:MAG: PQQ-binding-like beta-propeller repeat protein [Pirellulaceae bacterium]|jgi:outer membrane protein assembly factor BamB|nr:PQQ-binding-like beta-propeller repeat protein [Pirellulaceae bacterium]
MMPTRPTGRRRLLLVVLVLLSALSAAPAADQPQWGQRHSRNMVSDEKGLPDRFDPKTGENIKWSAAIGTQCWATPVVAGGKVLIGTNNSQPRDPKHEGDRGVLMCLNEADGSFAWQLVVPKLSEDMFFDWPQAGMCSPPTVEGDRVYTLTNRDEVVCLDLHGMANGNDGPYRDEGRHMAPSDQPALDPGPTDADILWLLDLRTAAGVRPHDSTHCSILLDGPYLYVNTSNGLTSRHDGVDKPNAPALVVVDKATGTLVAQEREGISQRIFHCQWSSPALGTVNGQRLIFLGGGDGWCYAFEALGEDKQGARGGRQGAGGGSVSGTEGTAAEVPSLRCVWRFDCDPTGPKKNIHSYIRNRRESPSIIKAMPVFYEDRLFVTVGGDIWWGKQQAWLQCIDATGSGDVTASALRWSYPVERHCCSTPAIHDGLAYVADCAGKVHCVDIKTGQASWVHDAGSEIWSSTLVADGKVYVGTRRGDFTVLAAGKELKVLSSIRLDDAVISTPVAANGTLFVGTMPRLFALQPSATGGGSKE